jgi:ABC-type dipeptide/oligopeptide/nickel transport system ATPase component
MATIDWYKKIPKKYLTESHNPHFKEHGIKVPFRALIVGSSGSGKTQTFMSLLHKMPDTFEKVYIVTLNKDEPLYNYLHDKYGDEKKGKLVEIREIGKEGMPDLDKFNKEQQTLVVMDDLINQKNQAPMIDFFIRARKKNASLIYITQSYYAVPKMIRNNISYIILKQVSSMRNLAMIMKEYGLGLKKKVIENMYEEATANRGFLLIDLENQEGKTFRKGWDEFFEIEAGDKE